MKINKSNESYDPYTDIVPIEVSKWVNKKIIILGLDHGTEYAHAYAGTCIKCGKESLIADYCPNCGNYNGGI